MTYVRMQSYVSIVQVLIVIQQSYFLVAYFSCYLLNSCFSALFSRVLWFCWQSNTFVIELMNICMNVSYAGSVIEDEFHRQTQLMNAVTQFLSTFIVHFVSFY